MSEEPRTVSKLGLPKIVIISAVFVFIASNILSLVVFQHSPWIHDEMDYLFQARLFAGGHLYLPSPCAKEAFDFPHMINNGRWYSQYPPGFPLVLIIGVVAGIPWIINPLLAALSIIVLFFLGKEVYGEREGRVAAILGAISIWLILMSSTMMSHTASMLFIAVFLLFLFRSLRHPSIRNGILAGAALGFAFLIRPYNAILVAIPFLVYFAVRLLKEPRLRLKNGIGLALPAVTFVLLLLAYNQLTNGSPWTMGYDVRYGTAHGLGFGKTGYLGTPHTPGSALLLLGENLGAINKHLFGWPGSSLFLFIPLLFSGGTRREDRRRDLLLFAGFLTLAAGLFFYWGTQVFLGARMYFEALPILLLLSAAGLARAPAIVARLWARAEGPIVWKGFAALLVVMTVFSFAYTLPRWIRPPDKGLFADQFVWNLRTVTPGLHRSVGQLRLGKSLIIMKLLNHPERAFPSGEWGSGFMFDRPGLQKPVIYARSRGSDDVQLLKCFSDRRACLYYGTVEKGVLVPMILREGTVTFGAPLSYLPGDQRSAEFLESPQTIFRAYSNDFQSFIESVFRSVPFQEVDVAFLIDQAYSAERAKDFARASLCYEAALQVEPSPEFRKLYLIRLASCYSRAGQKAEATRIQAAINEERIYDVFPERGF